MVHSNNKKLHEKSISIPPNAGKKQNEQVTCNRYSYEKETDV